MEATCFIAALRTCVLNILLYAFIISLKHLNVNAKRTKSREKHVWNTLPKESSTTLTLDFASTQAVKLF